MVSADGPLRTKVASIAASRMACKSAALFQVLSNLARPSWVPDIPRDALVRGETNSDFGFGSNGCSKNGFEL
jgi:hypothetical protein